MTNLRLAIVGFGKIATTRHVPAISGTSGVEMVAIADPSEDAQLGTQIVETTC